jgi:CubicO group peptidase (beta-lactamase class C family)
VRTRASTADRSAGGGPRRIAAPAEIDALLRAHVADLRLAGLAVVVVDREGVRFRGAYGRARRDGAAMTLDTPVVVGSTGKQFTGLAIRALVANEHLRLDDTIGDVLSHLGGADGALADVTVSQLLAHRSGLSRASGLDVFRLRTAGRSIRDQARRLLREEPIGSPGERFAYSNANYILLGAIIEAVTGASYEAALQHLVAEPLELLATTTDLHRARRAGLAEGEYTWFRLVNARTPGSVAQATAPAGYLASTARDLSVLLRAHLGGSTGLDPGVLAAARAPLSPAVPPSEYASGWVVRPLPEAAGLVGAPDGRSPRLWEHEGDSLRTMSYLAFVPELDVGVAMLTNTGLGTDGRRFTALSTELLHAVLGIPRPPRRVDRFLASVPLLFALPVLQVAASTGAVATGRSRRSSRAASAIASVSALALAAAGLITAFVVVPRRTQSRLTDSWWWVAVPDLAASVGASVAAAVGTFVLGARTALRCARQKTSGLGVEAWRIDTSAWRSKR